MMGKYAARTARRKERVAAAAIRPHYSEADAAASALYQLGGHIHLGPNFLRRSIKEEQRSLYLLGLLSGAAFAAPDDQ